jgi:hypothetical protein
MDLMLLLSQRLLNLLSSLNLGEVNYEQETY